MDGSADRGPGSVKSNALDARTSVRNSSAPTSAASVRTPLVAVGVVLAEKLDAADAPLELDADARGNTDVLPNKGDGDAGCVAAG